MQTTAAVLIHFNQPLEIQKLTLPDLLPGQVLVQIAYSGLCKSQWLEVKGKRGNDPFLPHTLGHEGSGIVLEVGEGVEKVRPGDHVVLTWIKGKGRNIPGTQYRNGDQIINSGAISTFLEKTIVSENRVVPISKKIPLKEAALLGCAIPTGSGIILNTMPKLAKGSLVIFGAGGVGLSALLAAKYIGFSKVVVMDIEAEKLQLAKKLGADEIILGNEKNSVRAFDIAIEAVGSKETMEAAFESVKSKGGMVVFAGNLPSGEKIEIDPFDFILGKRVVGTWGGETDPDRDIPKYVDMFLSGKFNLSPLITHQYSLLEINEAIQALEKRKVGRALIAFDCHDA